MYISTYFDRPVTSVAFHPSSSIIASASSDKSIKIYELRTHTLIQNYANAHCQDTSSTQLPNTQVLTEGITSIQFGGDCAQWLISTGTN